MSINSIANSAVARRPDMGIAETVPTDFRQIAQAARVMPTAVSSAPMRPLEIMGATAAMSGGPVAPSTPMAGGAARDSSAPVSAVDTAFNVLFGYIPTEIVTLYVAVVAAIASSATHEQQVACGTFFVATPIAVWLVYAAKLRAAGKPLPLSYGTWPVWEMVAATIAFAAWAVALPSSPLASSALADGLSGVLVLVTSTVLGLLSPLFQRPLAA